MKTLSIDKFKSLSDLENYFKDEQTCAKYLAEKRWHGAPICPRCSCNKIYHRGDGRYLCTDCGYTFSVKVGTVFQDTKLPLSTWFKAIYILCNCKQGISTRQMATTLGVTQKTSWFILQKIRILLQNKEYPDIVRGKIITIQGKRTRLKMRIADSPHNVHPAIQDFIISQSRIYSDEYICYQTLEESEDHKYKTEDPFPLRQRTSDNNKGGTINSLWLQIKRMVMGNYHFVSASLFHRYIYEAIFRDRFKKQTCTYRFEAMLGLTGSVITYKKVRPS